MNYYESEQAVIGALLEIGDMSLDAPTAILNIVKQASFSAIQHQTIFQNIKQMAAAGEHVDLITLDARLINQGKSELTGGFAYLVDLQKIASPSRSRLPISAPPPTLHSLSLRVPICHCWG